MRTGIAFLGLAIVAAGARLGSLVNQVPAKAAVIENPLQANRQAALAGAKLYGQECAACHGTNREGRVGPPLRRPEVIQAPAGVLFWILRNGSLHSGMPSFAHLPEPERWQIVTYLQETSGAEN
jgi:mono/diheme cytochrome c family protein